jgi:hypothetical protein
MPHPHPQQRVHQDSGVWRASPEAAMERRMTDKHPSRAGGSILAIAIIAGVVAGVIVGEPSIGFLAGLALGVAAAVLLWLLDRR